MKFLVIGDVVGSSGMDAIKKNVPAIIKKENIDFVIINGENATGGRGLKEKELYELYNVGADVVTMGNHIYYRKEAKILYKKEKRLLIPANVTNLDGKGSVVVNKNGIKLGVVNLIGKVHMGEIDNQYVSDPFAEAKKQINILKEQGADYIFVDFHAEATAEKIAMGNFLKEDVTCVYGTHTHVQTADEKIFNTGMAYITDVGMTGPDNSVLGLKTEIAVARFVTGEKIKYECSTNKATLHSIIVETDNITKKAVNITRYNIPNI